MKREIVDIPERFEDYQKIYKESFRHELGLRAVCIMYDDHSSDKNSMENIFILKENIQYRLNSAIHQYLVLIREIRTSEDYLQSIHKKDPKLIHGIYPYSPYVESTEVQISSIFDSIIFHLTSVFDYLSHMICYICKKDKKTRYWTKLVLWARDKNNEVSSLNISNTILSVDNRFVKELYDYRTRLIHNRRDKHRFLADIKLIDSDFNIKIVSSPSVMKHFKLANPTNYDKDYTLMYMSSWLIRQTFKELEELLEGLTVEIKNDSHFAQNVRQPKAKKFITVTLDPKTNNIKPLSEGFWEQYKNQSKSG